MRMGGALFSRVLDGVRAYTKYTEMRDFHEFLPPARLNIIRDTGSVGKISGVHACLIHAVG